jgi:hypothetical protein
MASTVELVRIQRTLSASAIANISHYKAQDVSNNAKNHSDVRHRKASETFFPEEKRQISNTKKEENKCRRLQVVKTVYGNQAYFQGMKTSVLDILDTLTMTGQGGDLTAAAKSNKQSSFINTRFPDVLWFPDILPYPIITKATTTMMKMNNKSGPKHIINDNKYNSSIKDTYYKDNTYHDNNEIDQSMQWHRFRNVSKAPWIHQHRRDKNMIYWSFLLDKATFGADLPVSYALS